MNRFFAILTSVALGSVCFAQQTAQRAIVAEARLVQIQAATGNATANLRDQLMLTPVTKELAIHDLVEKLGDTTFFAKAMQSSVTVGGARWINDQTCQVRVQLAGSIVANMLLQDARQHPESAPIPFDDLRRALSPLSRTMFVAVGSSAGGEKIETVRPQNLDSNWAQVNEPTRRKTIAEARQNAVNEVLADLSNIPLTATVSTKDALNQKEISGVVSAWLYRQPITKIEFLDNFSIEVTLSPNAVLLGSTLQSAVMNDHAFSQPLKIDWNSVRHDLVEQIAPVVGSASASPVRTTAPVAAAAALPTDPPDWADTQLNADATATEGGSRLKVARSAERIAIEKLRKQLLDLPIGSGKLSGLVQSNPQLDPAIDRIMLQAHTYKVDYHADGSVLVRVNLDLRNAWDELKSNP